jgi:hypothetical protein
MLSRWRIARLSAIIRGVEDKDASQEALEQVEKATDSDRAKGEDLLGSEDLVFISNSISDMRVAGTELKQRYSASRSCLTGRWHVSDAMKASARCKQRNVRQW